MSIPANRYRACPSGQLLVRQKMVKSGAYAATATQAQVPNWASDATYPCVVASHSLLVQGAGAVNVTASVNLTYAFGGTITATLRRNGTQIGSAVTASPAGVKTITWSGTLADGDTLSVYAGFASFGTSGVAEANTWIDVVPA